MYLKGHLTAQCLRLRSCELARDTVEGGRDGAGETPEPQSSEVVE